jgi:hypothetical protein
MGYREPRQIECLACATVRVVFGRRKEEIGVCVECGYPGWTYADDLDGTARNAIMSALEQGAVPEPVTAGPRPPARNRCRWNNQSVRPRAHSG